MLFRSNVNKIKMSLAKMYFAEKNAPLNGQEFKLDNKPILSALNDDLNTPKALGHFFADLSRLNENVWEVRKDSWPDIIHSAENWAETFGLDVEGVKIPLKVYFYAWRREKFRVSKQFEQSDRLRKKVDALGYIIEDTPRGPFLWPKPLN